MRTITVALALVALLAAGCSKKTASPTTTERPSASPRATAPVPLSGTVNDHGTKDISRSSSVEVEQDDFYFGPTFLKAAPGQRITVELKNEGKVPHTFTIDALRIDQEVQPDHRQTVTLTLPASGPVIFYCRFHRSMGMQGAFFFASGGATSPAPAAGSMGGY